jgi:hypothetical protein
VVGNFDNGLKRVKRETLDKNRKNFSKRVRETREREMLLLIQMHSTRGGLIKQEIAKKMEMDRHSIQPYLNNMLKKKLIQKNDKEKYLSTSPLEKDPIFKTRTFSIFFRRVLEDILPLILDRGLIKIDLNDLCIPKNLEIIQSSAKFRDLFKKFNNEMETEKILFEFSNRIGAFVTYLCIYSLSPDNHIEKNSTDRQKTTLSMVEEGIHQIAAYVLPIFARILYLNSISNLQSHNNKFQLNQDIINGLYYAFLRLYPTLTYEFERILDKRPFFSHILEYEPSKIEFYKDEVNSESKIAKRQKNCLHNFGSPFFIDKLEITIEKCKKCKFEKIEKYRKNSNKDLKKTM